MVGARPAVAPDNIRSFAMRHRRFARFQLNEIASFTL